MSTGQPTPTPTAPTESASEPPQRQGLSFKGLSEVWLDCRCRKLLTAALCWRWAVVTEAFSQPDLLSHRCEIARPRQSPGVGSPIFLVSSARDYSVHSTRPSEAINLVCIPQGCPSSCIPDGHLARSGLLITCVLGDCFIHEGQTESCHLYSLSPVIVTHVFGFVFRSLLGLKVNFVLPKSYSFLGITPPPNLTQPHPCLPI